MHCWNFFSAGFLVRQVAFDTASVSFVDLSVLPTWALLPFGLARWVTSSLLLRAWVHTLALSHNSTKASSIWKHFLLLSLSIIIPINGSNQVLLFIALRLPWVSCVGWSRSFSIQWRLRSDSVLRGSWSWLLRVRSFPVHHALVHVHVAATH